MKIERSLLNRKRARPSLWLALMALLALAGALRPPSAHAANITVAAGEVAISSNGLCSLREAIVNANADAATHADCTAGSAADVIILAAGTYSVANSYASYSGGTGLPQITSTITIEGNGATIDRSGAAVYRLFAVSSTGNLTLNDLMLTDGAMTSDVGGGAIYNDGGTLTINDSFLSGHNATNSQGGGAIRSNGGTVTINNSTLSGNQSGNSGGGGAIYAANGATLTINDSTLGGNSATNTNGGAISAWRSPPARRRVARSTRRAISFATATSARASITGLPSPGGWSCPTSPRGRRASLRAAAAQCCALTARASATPTCASRSRSARMCPATTPCASRPRCAC